MSARTDPTTDLPAWARRAACLLGAFVVAKIALVALRLGDGGGAGLRSPWAPVALVHHDVWTAGLAALVDGSVSLATRRSAAAVRWHDRVAWAMYAAAVAWVAFNVPVARVLSTPLTWALLGTAGGALADSIRIYLTFRNLGAAAMVLAAAAALPAVVRARPGPRALAVMGVIAPAGLVLGPRATRRVETLALHRNAVSALIVSAVAQARGGARSRSVADLPPLPREGDALDLGHLSGAAAGRHVVWVVLESTAARYLRPWGASDDPTPNLTALADHALVFPNAYAAYPESIKGLFSYVCAAYPSPYTDASRYAETRMPCASIAERLAAGGWRTGLFHSGRFVYLGMDDVLRGRGFEALEDAATIGGEHASSFGTDDASTVRRVLAFADGLRPGERLFALYLPIAGHHPYHAPGRGPGPWPEASELDAYKNDLFAGDAALGALLDGFRARGLFDRTLWVVSGDHGEAFFQHPGNFAHSLYVWDENVRVPLLLALPGVTALPVRAPQVASLVDVAPTILDLVGLSAPARWQGRSLLSPVPGVARFFTDHGLFQLGLRHGPWKIAIEVETGRSRLFDVASDPDERRNLADVFPDRVARYREHLGLWAAGQRARVADYRRVVLGER